MKLCSFIKIKKKYTMYINPFTTLYSKSYQVKSQ